MVFNSCYMRGIQNTNPKFWTHANIQNCWSVLDSYTIMYSMLFLRYFFGWRICVQTASPSWMVLEGSIDLEIHSLRRLNGVLELAKAFRHLRPLPRHSPAFMWFYVPDLVFSVFSCFPQFWPPDFRELPNFGYPAVARWKGHGSPELSAHPGGSWCLPRRHGLLEKFWRWFAE